MYTFEDLKFEFELYEDTYDPYGSTMNWFFPVCLVLHLKREVETPKKWGFRCGAASSIESDHESFLDEASDEALLEFGWWLHRRYEKHKLGGEDY